MKQVDLKVLKEIIDYLSDDVMIFLATKDDCVKQKQSELDGNKLTSSYINKEPVVIKYFGENKVSMMPIYGIGEVTNQTQLVDEIDAILNKPSDLV